MVFETREQAREYLREQLPRELPRAKKCGFVCPLCGNGDGADGTGITEKGGGKRYHCFRCAFHGDYLDYLKAQYKETESGVFKRRGITISKDTPHTYTRQAPPRPPEIPQPTSDTSPQSFTLYRSTGREQKDTTVYPHKAEITNLEQFKKVIQFDHVAATYKGNKRSKDNFISSNCIMMDIDNESDNPADWITAEQVSEAFADVPHYISYSRNHNKEKGGKAARPRFHVYFTIDEVNNVESYTAIKKALLEYFPAFDAGAANAAQPFFGVEKPQAEHIPGNKNLLQLLQEKTKTAHSGIVDRLIQLDAFYSYTADDKGFAAVFADLYKEILRYNATAKMWYFYDGKRWAADDGDMRAARYMKEFADGMIAYCSTLPDGESKTTYLKRIWKLSQFGYRQTILNDARERHYITRADLDRNTNLFNCQNGTLDLIELTFHPHNPEDMLSKISNVYYNPITRSTLWEKTIEGIMQADEEKTTYLQKVLSLGITAETDEETSWFLFGASTRNGKSTIIETALYLFGDYGATIQPQSLALLNDKSGRQASGDIARLDGVRFLNCPEPPKKLRIDVALLKQLLGNDTITARHLHEREFEFQPQFKLFINTNFLPLIGDDTLFASGRINVITFEKHFTQAEQDKTLKQQLKTRDNISGVFNWLLDGLRLYREVGATPPPIVEAATTDYRNSSDKIGTFFSDCMDKTGNNSKGGDVYEVYKQWCDDCGFGVENKNNFFDELKVRGFFADSGTVKGATYRNIVRGWTPKTDDLPM